MKRFLQQGIQNILHKFGYEIKRYSLETSVDARLTHLLKHYDIDCILDVGANEGHSAWHYRKIGYTGDIVSFEALSSAHHALLKHSQQDTRWHIAPRAAIGNENGEITLHIANNSFSSSVLNMNPLHAETAPESQYVGAEIVQMQTLDEAAQPFLSKANHIFLKLDVQGFEAQVLEGASNILPKVCAIQLEMSFAPLYEGEKLYLEMLSLLETLGYELYALIPGFSDPKSGKMLQADGIFTRREAS